MNAGIDLIQGSAGASGATACEAAIASAMAVDEVGIERTGFGQMIDGLALVEAGHFDRIFDRRARLRRCSSDPSSSCVIGTTRR